MTPPPPCPGGPRYRHARAAKATAYNAEPDRRKRPVYVKCADGHHHLVAREQPEPEMRTR
jgi:hypothetical protein